MSKQCLACGMALPSGRRKFCSGQCKSDHSIALSPPCIICGQKTGHKSQKYCSRECVNEHRRITTKHRTCEYCGKDYVKRCHNPDEGNRFCSRKCASHSRAVAADGAVRSSVTPVKFLQCAECGKTFNSRNARKYCCDGCSYSAQLRQLRERKKAESTKSLNCTCVECGAGFVAFHGDKRTRFCSGECGKKHHKRIARKKERARNRGVYRESVDPIEVFNRDSWRCQICKRKTLKSKRGTIHLRAPELDHIIPLSRGGSHSWDNVQCACRECNGAKSARIYGQLNLFPIETKPPYTTRGMAPQNPENAAL